eukprot:GHVS01064295.1.p1 GENE.GHVS01064295.1~~GHVS01064295.1.p1  ORF type:complete len:688 (+),score=120.27 GHVS01064295.1:117-2066(+)
MGPSWADGSSPVTATSTPPTLLPPSPRPALALSSPSSPSSVHKSSREYSQSLYREYAEHYYERFRAAIDYQFEEKPRQISSGLLLIALLLLIAFQDELSHFLFGRTITPSANLDSPDALLLLPPLTCPLAPRAWCQPWCDLLQDPDFTASLSSFLRRGIIAMLVVLLVYCFLQTRDGLLVRPHPGVWRVVHAVGLFYFLIISILLVLPPDCGRYLLGLLLPGVPEYRLSRGANLFAGTLELDCSLTVTSLWRQLRTPWFAAHVVGWLVKMCIFRDWLFCLIYSATFELCELSFQWLVPELRECWWDSVVLDFMFANILGMILGVGCLRFLNSYQYDWVGQRPFYQKALLCLLPFTWSEYHWRFFRTPQRFFQAVPVLVLSNVAELNVFFLMYAMDLPASHLIHPLRCVCICALASAGVAEHYQYMNSNGKRLGHNEWLLVLIISVECLVCGKYGYTKFGKLLPPSSVCLPWAASTLLFSLWCFCHFVYGDPSPETSPNTQHSTDGREWMAAGGLLFSPFSAEGGILASPTSFLNALKHRRSRNADTLFADTKRSKGGRKDHDDMVVNGMMEDEGQPKGRADIATPSNSGGHDGGGSTPAIHNNSGGGGGGGGGGFATNGIVFSACRVVLCIPPLFMFLPLLPLVKYYYY